MRELSSHQDTGHGTARNRYNLWLILSLVTGAALTQGLMRQGLPVLYPFIQDELALSRAQVGLITAALSGGTAATVILAGWLTDIFGVKRMISVAMLALAAFILVFPAVSSFVVLIGLVVIIGIVSSPLNPSISRAVIDWFPIKVRASAMSVKQMGIPLAGAASAAILPALAVAMGWRAAAAVTGLLVLVIAFAFITLYRDAPRTGNSTQKFSLATLKTILRNRSLVITVLWGTTLIGFQYVTLSYFMLFLVQELGLSPIVAGGVLAAAQVSSVIGRVFWGAVSDFVFGGRRLPVLALTGFLTVLWMVGASLVDGGVSIAVMYVMAVVIGLSTLSFHGVFITFIGEQAAPGETGVTLGVGITAIQTGQMLMPPLFGYLVDITDSYSTGWRTIAGAALLCTLVLVAFARGQQRR